MNIQNFENPEHKKFGKFKVPSKGPFVSTDRQRDSLKFGFFLGTYSARKVAFVNLKYLTRVHL